MTRKRKSMHVVVRNRYCIVPTITARLDLFEQHTGIFGSIHRTPVLPGCGSLSVSTPAGSRFINTVQSFRAWRRLLNREIIFFFSNLHTHTNRWPLRTLLTKRHITCRSREISWLASWRCFYKQSEQTRAEPKIFTQHIFMSCNCTSCCCSLKCRETPVCCDKVAAQLLTDKHWHYIGQHTYRQVAAVRPNFYLMNSHSHDAATQTTVL